MESERRRKMRLERRCVVEERRKKRVQTQIIERAGEDRKNIHK